MGEGLTTELFLIIVGVSVSVIACLITIIGRIIYIIAKNFADDYNKRNAENDKLISWWKSEVGWETKPDGNITRNMREIDDDVRKLKKRVDDLDRSVIKLESRK